MSRVLYIEWVDHCSSSNQWQSPAMFHVGNRGFPCASIGRVVAENDEAITLCGTWAADGDAKADQVILKNCITKKRRIHLP